MSTRRPRARGWPRGRRWARRTLRALATAVALAVVLALVVVHSLDRPWVKRRVQALVLAKAGVAIDYGAVRVSLLSGIDVRDLVVFSPAEVKAVAPELARVEHLTARWSLADRRVLDVDVDGAAVTIAVDETGRTTLDIVSPPSKEPTPLSREGELLASPLPVEHVSLANVSVAIVSTRKGVETSRTKVSGLALDAVAEPGADGSRLEARLGSETSPLSIAVERSGEGAGEARGEAWILAHASPSALTAAIDARVTSQTFAPGAHVSDALHARARALFRPRDRETDVTLEARAGDGASTTEGSVMIPDDGAVLVRWAAGDVDLARAIAIAPPGLLPLELARGEMRFRVARTVVGAAPRVLDGGSAIVKGELADVRVRVGAEETASAGDATFDLRAAPAPEGEKDLRASIALHAVDALGARTDGVTLEASGKQHAGGAIDGSARLGVASLDRGALAARDADVTLDVHGLELREGAPLATRGDVVLSGTVASLRARSRAAIESLALHAHAALTGAAPIAADATLSATRVRAFDAAGRAVADAPARVALHLEGVTPDLAAPRETNGTARLEATLGDLEAKLDATKTKDAIDFALAANAKSLAAARPFAANAPVPLERMTLGLDWRGRVERIWSALPAIHERAKIDVGSPAIGSIAARSVAIDLQSNGTAMTHDATLDLRAIALALPGADAVDEHAVVTTKIDRARRSLALDLTTEGYARSKLALTSSWDAARRGLVYDVRATASDLGPLRPLVAAVSGLDGVDVAGLAVEASAKGELFGVVTDVGEDGSVKLAPRPSLGVAVVGTSDVTVSGFAYARGEVAVQVPKVSWHADFGLGASGRTLASHLDAPAIHLASGRYVLDASGVSDDLSAVVSGDLANPDATVDDHFAMRALQQDAAPLVPVGDVTLDFSARRDHEGVVHLKKLAFENALGGQTLGVRGTLDLSGIRRTLALRGTLEQDLAKLTKDPTAFVGRGKVSMSARFESADLVDFLARADVKLAGVDVHLPRSSVDVVSADGEIPINLALRAGRAGLKLLHDDHASKYSLLRFSDQHPLLSRSSFLRIQRIQTPWIAIEPLVANVQIDRNVVSLPQFEMGVRKGRVTGQSALDWDGESSTLELHLRATGVLSSYGEPFDGNAALTVSAAQRSVEGRAEILRIGKRHLLDLLDVEDPTRTDASINRVRSALAWGYPKRVRLGFEHGFASARIELGGLGSLLSIGELRGMPMGPLIDRALAPLLRKGRR